MIFTPYNVIRSCLRNIGRKLQSAYDSLLTDRRTMLLDLRNHYNLSHKIEDARAISIIMKSEARRRTHQKIKQLQSPMKPLTSIQLEIPSTISSIPDMWQSLKVLNNPITDWVTLSSKQETERNFSSLTYLLRGLVLNM